MKRVIPNLRVGQNIVVQIQECVSEKVIIVSVYGDLIRVNNDSGYKLLPGQCVNLKVFTLKPLKFKFATGQNPIKGRFDLLA